MKANAMEYRESMMILRTKRCKESCYFCGYRNDKANILERVPPVEEMINQTLGFISGRQKALDATKELYIVNSGSFFSNQVPRAYMVWLANHIYALNTVDCRGLNLVLESRADTKFENYKDELEALVKSTPLDQNGRHRFTIALGLEVADDGALNKLKKRCTLDQYISASEKVKSFGGNIKAYVMFGLPFIGDPPFIGRKYVDRSIEMGFRTILFAINEMGVVRVGFNPAYPSKGTELSKLCSSRQWAPISATESYEILRIARSYFPEIDFDFSSRQIHFPHGRWAPDDARVDAKDEVQKNKAIDNVKTIAKKVLQS